MARDTPRSYGPIILLIVATYVVALMATRPQLVPVLVLAQTGTVFRVLRVAGRAGPAPYAASRCSR